MAASALISEPQVRTHRPTRPKALFVLAIALAVIAATFLVYLIILAVNWPFTKQALIDVLQEGSLRTVTIQRFRSTVFPPGCVAEGIAFEHLKHKDKPPIMYIPTLTIRANWGALLTFQRRLSSVTAEGMQVTVPRSQDGSFNPLMPLNHTDQKTPRFSVETVLIYRAGVSFMRPGRQDFKLKVNKLVLHKIGMNTVIPYEADVYNTEPPGNIQSTGVFGPWNPNSANGTALHGTFVYRNANLAYYRWMSGTLNGQGSFSGKLNSVEITGESQVSHFKLSDTSHSRELKTKFDVVLDGPHGNAILRGIDAQFDRTVLHLSGSVQDDGGKGKTIAVDIPGGRGRIEDLVNLFISGPKSPITGNITFAARISVPPGPDDFVKRMKLDGGFGISGGKFTDRETQADLTRLSKSALKETSENPATVLSDLKAHASSLNGLAHLTNTSFSMPGAHAFLDGTYNLENYKTDFYGVLVTQGDVSKSTTGIKAFFMKALTPFFKRKHGDKIVGFHLTGKYGQTNVMFDPDAGAQFQKTPAKRN